MITDVLHNFNLFVDGRGQAGKISEHKLPKIAVKTEGFSAGGMAAEVEVPMGSVEKLETEFTLVGYNVEVLKQLRLLPGRSMALTSRGSLAGLDGVEKPVVVNMRGNMLEVDADAWKPANKAELKCKMNLDYYRLEIDGKVVYEIDPINCVAIVDGVDTLATTRQNLGI